MRTLLVIVFIAGCGGSSSSSTTGPAQQSLVVQTAGGQSTTIAAAGATVQLAAFQSEAGPYGNTLNPVSPTWSSSNTSVATVDANGVVTAVADGTAVISAMFGAATGHITLTVGSALAPVTIEWNLGAQTTPVSTTIAAGTPVRWHAADTSHTVTPDTTPPPAAVAVGQGATTATQTITTKGTYHYHCTIHPAMTGTLIVQ